MNKKILCVDDDEHILESYRRSIRKFFQIETALGGEEGLQKEADSGPFAVVVSDLKMPGMDGIQFLTKMRACAPDSVRIMLTGQADLNTAIDAVNEGNIFRFLTKPCTVEALLKAVSDGVEQYRLITAEKELLEKTLSGSIKLLTEVLSLVSPAAFGKSLRIQRYMRSLAVALGRESSWEFDLAGLLSQIGYVTIPPEIQNKVEKNLKLASDELSMFNEHPGIAQDLISNIPRLEAIAEIIAYQEKDFNGEGPPEEQTSGEDIPLGARALHVANNFDTLVMGGETHKAAIFKLKAQEGRFDPAVITALQSIYKAEAHYEAKSLDIIDLRPGMILADDVYAATGVLLVPKGQEATTALIAKLKNFNVSMGVKQPISVVIKE